MNRIISLFLFIFIASCLNGQYNSPIKNKVTLGVQTSADGLVWRGRLADTANLLTNKLDTSVYIVLDTGTRAMWYYRASTTPKWTRLVDSLNNLQGQLSLTTKVTGTLPLGNGGTGSATQNFVDLTTTQIIGGAKTFTSAVTATRFNPTSSTATGTGMFLPAANTLGFTVSNEEFIRISSSGRVGINNSNPITFLDVSSGDLNTVANLRSTDPGAFMGFADNTTTLDAGISTSSIGVIGDNFIINTANSEKMRITSAGNLGLGVTPSAWKSNFKALMVNTQGAAISGRSDNQSLNLSTNWYEDSGGEDRYINSDFASRYLQFAGSHRWFNAPSGTAGNVITFTQAMTLDASGNLGIGTASPTARLHVKGVDVTDSNFALKVEDSNNLNLLSVKNNGDVTLKNPLSVANGGTNTSTLTANKVMVGNGTSGVLTPNLLSWNNSSNYLGVGTSSPVSILDVVGNIPAGGGGGGLRFVPTVANDGTTQYGITISGAGSGAGQFIAIGVRNSTASTKASAMWVEATQPGLNIGYDYADVAPNNGAIINGEVRIGYTADQGAYPLQVNGQIFATNATIATSDEKFKENIIPLNKGLEIVNKLKPVTFNFISDTKNNFSVYEEVGFIAQDVDRALSTESFAKSIVKAADDSDPTSTMGLATQNLIPVLVKAIQEQQALIKALEQRLLILENK